MRSFVTVSRTSRKLTSVLGVAPLVAALFGAVAAAACGGEDVICGPGTRKDGQTCLPEAVAAGGDGAGGSAGSGGGGGNGGTAEAPKPEFSGATAIAPVSSTALLVAWAPAEDALTPAALMVYDVFVSTTAGEHNFSTPTVSTPGGATSAIVGGLDAKSTYFVVVRARNALGASDTNTVEVSAKPKDDTTAPTFAGATKAVTAAGGKVLVSWSAGKDDLTPTGALRYAVYASEKSGEEAFVVPTFVSEPGATSAAVTVPKAGVEFFFVVRAMDAAGNTDSNTKEQKATSGTDTQPPVFGGCTAAIKTGPASVELRWNAATDDVAPAAALTYDLFASKKANAFDFTAPAKTLTAGELTGELTGLDPASTYFFVCRASDPSGNQDKNLALRTAKTDDDGVPPVFAGVKAVDVIGSTEVTLSWEAATDNKSAASKISYRVFSAPALADLVTPGEPVVTVTGETSVKLTGLNSNTELFFLVRAVDEAGNVEDNQVTQTATTLVSFKVDIEAAIFADKCTSCHGGLVPLAGMSLARGDAYGALVGVPSTYAPPSGGTLLRVKANDAPNSYIFRKIYGIKAELDFGGDRMPPPASGDVLSSEARDLIELWINQGAENN